MPRAAPRLQGEDIATKPGANGRAACASCHGAKGEGNAAAGFPRLAGLNAGYLKDQLENFANDKRQNPVMTPIAKQLSAAERDAVSAYFGKLAGKKAGRLATR